MLDKSTCKKLDKILNELKKNRSGDVMEFCRQNFKHKETKKEKKILLPTDVYDKIIRKPLEHEYEELISMLVNDKYAGRPGQPPVKSHLIITDAGRIFKGYIKERRNKILSIVGKYILWISLVAGGLFAAVYYVIQIFKLCLCN